MCCDVFTLFLSHHSYTYMYFILIDAVFYRDSSDVTLVWIASSTRMLFNVIILTLWQSCILSTVALINEYMSEPG